MILLNQAGKNTHEHICESLDLFAREVMPEFHARIPEQEEWKAKVLAREIELEEIDTQPFRDRYGPNSVQLDPGAGGGVGSVRFYHEGHEGFAKDTKALSGRAQRRRCNISVKATRMRHRTPSPSADIIDALRAENRS